MTRNFEEEYRKYAENSVPDLWSRIEAAIDEADRAESIKKSTNAVSSEKTVSIPNKKIVSINHPYMTLIAACACLLIAIGVVRFIGSAGKSYSAAPASYEAAAPAANDNAEAASEAGSDSAMAEAEESYDEAFAEEAVTEAAEAEYEDSAPMADEAQTDMAAPAAAAEARSPEAAEEFAAEETETLGLTNGINGNMNYKGETSAAGVDVPLYDVTVRCIINDTETTKEGNIIKVTVTDPLDSSLHEDEELKLYADEDIYNELIEEISGKNAEKEHVLQLEYEDGKYFLKNFKIFP